MASVGTWSDGFYRMGGAGGSWGLFPALPHTCTRNLGGSPWWKAPASPDHQHSLWVSLGGCVGSPPRRAVPVSCRGGEERPCEQGCFSQARTLTGFAVCRSLVTWRLVSVAGGLQAVDLAFVSVSWFGATRVRGRLEGMVFGYINVKGI